MPRISRPLPSYLHTTMAANILLQWFPHTAAPFIANAPMFGFTDAGLATAVGKAGGFGIANRTDC